MNKVVTREQVLEANIKVHSAISKNYNSDTHWRPENQKKVRAHLERLRSSLPNADGDKSLLDIGCGTGFIIHLANDLFKRIDGIDITEAMLAQVDLTLGNVHIKIAEAENTGFSDNSMDMVTAYSFLDHLYKVEPVFQEVYRVLKPGGIFYADLNPNRAFWASISQLSGMSEFNPIVQREIDMLVQGDTLSNALGLNRELMKMSEPGKSYLNGFVKEELEILGHQIGFSHVEVAFDWFLGQADLIHNHPKENAAIVQHFLERALPLTSHLFKYLRIELIK